MLTLDAAAITLTATARDKTDAIRQLADALTAGGLVDADYVNGMLTREQQTSTYLGNGIAIPHGTPETRPLVKQTGVRVMRFAKGVAWGDGQTVRTAIAIAAQSDEHLAILRQLTRVISDDQLAEQLHTTTDAAEVAAILNGVTPASGMLFDTSLIVLDAEPAPLATAQAQLAARLFGAGAIDSRGVAALCDTRALPLGQGVWLASAATGIRRSAIAALGFSHAVQQHGEPVQLVIAVAAKDDQPVAVLERLAHLGSRGQLARLAQTRHGQTLLNTLTGPELSGPSAECVLAIKDGLHARPAAALARVAKSGSARLWLENLDGDEPAVAADSVTKLLGLGVRYGDRLRLTASGDDADTLLAAAIAAVNDGLGDVVVPLPATGTPTAAEPAEAVVTAPVAGSRVQGIGAAPGIAIAPSFQPRARVLDLPRDGAGIAVEARQLQEAIAEATVALANAAGTASNAQVAAIISMHQELLADPALADGAHSAIGKGASAAWAWHASYTQLAATQAASKNPLLAERAADIRDVGERVLALLTGHSREQAPTEAHVLICDELAPSTVAELNPEQVVAIVTARGGATSHAAILARARAIPLVVGVGDGILALDNGVLLAVDGRRGAIDVAPPAAAVDHLRQRQAQLQAQLDAANAERHHQAATTDGHRVEVAANLGNADGVAKAVAAGAEGVGLLRSEFIFMAMAQEPSVDEQIAIYRHILDGLDGKPLVVRTLDVGGDKPLPYLPMAPEENPFLGLRGARLSLRAPALLKRQLHALLAAAADRPLRIMFPMVTELAEWRELKAIYDSVATDFPNAQVELGVMIEVPAAVICADALAAEVDFFSIGTNDLTQYTLAIDRGHPLLSAQADSLHPAVLRLIDQTVRAAHAAGIWVGVCGELAADPLGAAILTGMGVDELSMSAGAIALVKAQIRSLSLADAQGLARQALACSGADAVRALEGDHA